MEKVLWLIKHVKSGLRSFMLKISPQLGDAPQLGRPVGVNSNQIEILIGNN